MAGLVDWFDAAGPEFSAQLGLAAVPAADGIALRAAGLPGFLFNRAFGFGFDAPLDEPELERILASYRGIPQFSIQPCPFADPPATRRWLDARGHRAYFNWVKWIRTTDDPPAAAADVRIERIGRDHASLFAELAAALFSLPSTKSWTERVVGRPNWTHYVAFDGDTPVAIAALFVHAEAANLISAGTIESHRGRGIQRALIARRIRDAAAAGCRWAVVETADDRPDRPSPSFRNQGRAGFRLLYRRPSHIWPDPARVPPAPSSDAATPPGGEPAT